MPAPTVTSPNIILDPGYLFWAPLGTALPVNTVAGSVFTDAWVAPWVWLGTTVEGSALTTSVSVEYIRAAEIFNPVGSSVTEQNSSITFAALDFTLKNLQRINNGGVITPVSGTGATTLSKYAPPTQSGVTRAMIGWESRDATLRAILFQTINSSDIEMQFRKAPDAASIPATFTCEVPAGTTDPWNMFSAGTVRLGV